MECGVRSQERAEKSDTRDYSPEIACPFGRLRSQGVRDHLDDDSRFTPNARADFRPCIAQVPAEAAQYGARWPAEREDWTSERNCWMIGRQPGHDAWVRRTALEPGLGGGRRPIGRLRETQEEK
jgi:hypothetical protein